MEEKDPYVICKPGFTINVTQLAQGIYNLCREHPDRDCMILGMFPADIMYALDNELKAKIPDVYLERVGLTEHNGAALRAEVTQAVCSEVLSISKAQKILAV